MIVDEQDYLAHYGILRRSGRYPWGSGGTQSQRNRSFLDTVAQLRKQGMSDAEIAKGFDMSRNQLTALRSIAINEQKQSNIRQATRLADKGYSNVKIGEIMGINESSVRSLLNPSQKQKADVLQSTANMLKDQVKEKGYIDIGVGVENQLGLTQTKLATAVAVLREQGYEVHNVKVPQVGTGEMTNVKVLALPGTTQKDVWMNRSQIQQINAFTENGGTKYVTPHPPVNLSSKRVDIKYGPDGGAQRDGVIELRPGVDDLSLGQSRYAQVRIAVDGTHYIKGMALYNPDLPEGVDVRFNTNKKNTGNKLDALKPMETTPDGKIDIHNPFGASIKPNGQRGVLNVIYEEGDWDTWTKSLPSQMLSKQNPDLAKTQLNLTYEQRRSSLAEISSLTNPAVKRKLLESFADDADSAAVHLKAAALPRQATKVILPMTTVKDKEVYAPSFRDGEPVALVRFPHGGTFEIPVLTVNNRNAEAKKLMGSDVKDAIGISSKVAQRLSGADFDGDNVLVIPTGRVKITSTPALEGLKGFDPHSYKRPSDSPVPKISSAHKHQQMGVVSNLITDMTIKGASTEELSRAVRHSMVVIDAEKHDLDFRASARDFGIKQLKAKYQSQPGGKTGASTLISRASADVRVLERKPRPAKDGGPVDKATGKKVFVETGRTFTNRKGEVVPKTIVSKRLAETDNAYTLTSGPPPTKIESLYADHSNRLKALANEARKERVNTAPIPYSPSAKKVYTKEVDELNAALNVAKMNAPLERQAQLIANATIAQKKQANPHMDDDDLKKIRNQALVQARIRTGAGKKRIDLTQSQWDAIQAGAITNNKLEEILNNADLDTVKKLATPRTPPVMTSVKTSRARAMLASGYTQAEVADAVGVSLSTLKATLA